MDASLNVESRHPEFYDYLRYCISEGDSIAQHGTYHLYDTSDSGLLGIHPRSEFSGHSYQVQYDKIKAGKLYLESENIWMPYFMAPSHSFDINTILALKELNFSAITDGYGFYPYTVAGLTLVPQLFSRPFHFPFGLQTLCIHINTINADRLNILVEFIKFNSSKFISFQDALQERVADNIYRKMIRNTSQLALKFIRRR